MEPWAFWMTLVVIAVIFAALTSFIAVRARERIDHAHKLAYTAVCEIAEGARTLDELAQHEFRTMLSMTENTAKFSRMSGGSGAAGQARMRGAEVYRNSYVAEFRARFQRHLAKYNQNMRALLEELGEDPLRYAVPEIPDDEYLDARPEEENVKEVDTRVGLRALPPSDV